SFDKAVQNLLSIGVLDRDKAELAIPSGKVAIERRGVQKVEVLESFFTPNEAIAELLHRIEGEFEELPEEAYSMARLWGEEFIKPNLIYDSVSTERARHIAISSVPLAKGIVKRDELIVDRHIRITPEIFAKLRSLDIKHRELRENNKRSEWMLWLGRGLILALIVVGIGGIVMRYYPNVWRAPKLVGVIIVLWVLFHLFQIGIVRRWEILFLLPAGALGMLLVVTVGERVSIPLLAAVSLTTSYLSDYQWISGVIALILGVTGALGASAYQSRKEIVRCVVPLLIVGSILWVGLYLLGVMVREEMEVNGLAVIANAGLTPVVVLGMAALIETGFRITTNLKLVELVDLNQPLLRELANRVPGTYHHSLLLGSLAESAARAIGANGLLTRAGAYYHDIGKMEIGEYFIENLAQGAENIHDRLSPETSAQLVIEHITRGVELGRKHRLPPEIIAFIPEHHGTSLAAYFYAKAQRMRGDKVEENQFRYPGPKPQSRETGIVMLADSVEAATHSLDNPTPEEIASLVDSLFQMRINDGQLEECPLTFKELDIIKKSFIKTLNGVYHQRTQYPKISNNESSPVTGEERDEISISISSDL
ncbi:MAG: HD family phosphohydrolase, partial [bacterium]